MFSMSYSQDEKKYTEIKGGKDVRPPVIPSLN